MFLQQALDCFKQQMNDRKSTKSAYSVFTLEWVVLHLIQRCFDNHSQTGITYHEAGLKDVLENMQAADNVCTVKCTDVEYLRVRAQSAA